MKYCLSFICFLALANVTLAQENTTYYTEDELASHASFMDAMVQKYQGNNTKAIDQFKKILKKDATNHSVAFEIAKLHVEQKNLPEAIRYAEKAASQDSNNKWYLNLLANAHLETGEYDKAIPYLSALKNKDSGNRGYYEDLAYSYLKEQQSDKALMELNALEKIIGIDESNIKKKFEIYKGKGDKENAEKELIKLSNSAPQNTDYLNNLARFYKNSGQNDKSKDVYAKILKINPDDTHANLAVAADLGQNNNASAYLLSLKNVLENPEISVDAKIKELLPHIEEVSESSDSSLIRSLENSLKSLRLSHPESAKTYAISGDFYNRLKNDDKALGFYERTLSINDNIYTVWEQVFFVLNDKKDFKALKSKTEAAIDLFPNQASSYIMHARALIELGEKDDAKDYLSEARLIAGQNPAFLKQIEVLMKDIK